MAKMVRQFTLNKAIHEPQAIDMPKRARIMSVHSINTRVLIDAEVHEDEDTKAFDRAHQRHFQIITAGELIPEGMQVGNFVATSRERQTRVYHVFEVRGR
jgi:hypothetical protein